MYDTAIVDVILAGIGGITVVGITQIIKNFLKATGIGAILISLVVSAGATAYYLASTGTFGALSMIGYTLLVFATANGIFRATHQAQSLSSNK